MAGDPPGRLGEYRDCWVFGLATTGPRAKCQAHRSCASAKPSATAGAWSYSTCSPNPSVP
jgi:hypothetical protein